MTQPASQASMNSSRLVRLLAELSLTDGKGNQQNFGERLGNLIDFSNSIILSAAHGELKGIDFEKRTHSAEKAKQEFLKVRSTLVETIVKSTTLGSEDNRIKLPSAGSKTAQELKEYESFKRFYIAHQRAIDFKLEYLRLMLRDEVSGCSPKLAQLALLDTALDDTLMNHTRRFFSALPHLLEKRFTYLRDQYFTEQANSQQPQDWYLEGAWLHGFAKELQSLLLAELEVRLQPVLGLLEALNQEVETPK